jgi:hypothetical protein
MSTALGASVQMKKNNRDGRKPLALSSRGINPLETGADRKTVTLYCFVRWTRCAQINTKIWPLHKKITTLEAFELVSGFADAR